jgi:hypothetical protein
MTLVCGQRMGLKDTSIIVSHLIVIFFLTEYKISYFTMLDLLGKGFPLLWWWYDAGC